jgi:pyridoxamine 5'-phosphate oxidase
MRKSDEMLPTRLPREPLPLVQQWLDTAVRRRMQPNPNAMTLATVDTRGHPSARVVLCKGIVAKPGYITFYTNYLSRKGQELAANARAAAVIHWDHLHRQVRIEGRVVKASAADSDAYFATRHWQSRIGAWASRQSMPMASRKELLDEVALITQQLGLPETRGRRIPDDDVIIPRPPFWGGYQLWADSVELWVEGSARIHDRARWKRTLASRRAGFKCGAWSATRLQP